MEKQKLLSLFKQEKQRILENVFNPIFEVLNNKEYDLFFDYYLIVNMNMEIIQQKQQLEPISFTDLNDLYKKLEDIKYQKIKSKVISKILNSYNFEIFKIVFGAENYEDWAIAFFKFIIYSYFKANGIENLTGQIALGTFNPVVLMNYKNNFEIFNNIIYKHIYGYSQTSIHNVEYWQRITGISKKQHYRFYEIVNDINPGIYLINSFLYFNSNNKLSYYLTNKIHEYKSFKPNQKINLIDKNKAFEWVVNYFACLTLNSKLQIGIWKAIQNLTFGTKVGLNVIALRTISEINVNLKNIWSLSNDDKLFFRNLKYQALWKINPPPTFLEFISQDAQFVSSQIMPQLKKFIDLRDKMLFNKKIEEAEQAKSAEEIIKKLQETSYDKYKK